MVAVGKCREVSYLPVKLLLLECICAVEKIAFVLWVPFSQMQLDIALQAAHSMDWSTSLVLALSSHEARHQNEKQTVAVHGGNALCVGEDACAACNRVFESMDWHHPGV